MIYVLGVDHHKEQIPKTTNDQPSVEHLRNFVREFSKEKKITLIAEEWCEDARFQSLTNRTHTEAVASELGTQHLPCDPGIAQRKAMGFKDRWEIAIEIGVPFPYTEDTAQERENARKINIAAEKYDKKREEYWLDEIVKNGGGDKEILLVCGFEHTDSFVSMAKRNGYETTRVDLK